MNSKRMGRRTGKGMPMADSKPLAPSFARIRAAMGFEC